MNKAINVDEFGNHTTDPTTLRQMAWAIVTSGGHFHFEDVPVDHTAVLSPIVNNIRAFVETPVGSASLPWNFVGSKPFAGTDPNANLTISDEPFCMAHDPADTSGTQDYVCFFTQDHSTIGARLKAMPAGKYYVRWWNPRNAAVSEYYDPDHHTGGEDLWTIPSPLDATGSDWVLFVRNEVPDLPATNLTITNDDTYALVLPGQSGLKYTIKVTNPTGTSVNNANVTDTFPADFQNVAWTCAGAGGGTCTAASGTNNISQNVNLPVGSSVTFMATGTVSGASPPAPTLTNVAQVQPPSAPLLTATDVDVIVDLRTDPGRGLKFNILTPCRLVDTRDLNNGGPMLMGMRTRDFAVTGKCGIPSGARALRLNVTVTGPSTTGFIRLKPTGDSVNAIATVNYSAGQTRGNNAFVSLSASAMMSAYLGTPLGSAAHVIIDVNGYFGYFQ